jgi:hypothetical protein
MSLKTVRVELCSSAMAAAVEVLHIAPRPSTSLFVASDRAVLVATYEYRPDERMLVEEGGIFRIHPSTHVTTVYGRGVRKLVGTAGGWSGSSMAAGFVGCRRMVDRPSASNSTSGTRPSTGHRSTCDVRLRLLAAVAGAASLRRG